MHYFKEVLASRELLANLTLREIRGKYKRTVFGQLWSLANPLALMLIYTFVFSFIFRVPIAPGDPSGLEAFPLWLLCGLLPFTFVTNVINQGVSSLVANSGLIQKVYFNRIVLPLSLTASATYNWLFEMGVLLIALLIAGSFVLPWIPLLLAVMVLLTIFSAGVGLMLSIANVYFRDTQYFVGILLQIWMYLSPVIYPVTLVKTASDDFGGLFGSSVHLIDIYKLNPMEHFITIFRNLLYDNRFPEPTEWLVCGLWALIMFALGLVVFRRNERNLAEAL